MTDRPVRHPAKFNDAILEQIGWILQREATRVAHTDLPEHDPRFPPGADVWPLRVLDPFGGVGRLHELRRPAIDTFVIELEPEWASQAAELGTTWCGDFFEFAAWTSDSWHAVVTSPTYGNRMADNHTPSPEDTSKRNTYTHTLGRQPSPGSSCTLQWGHAYRRFHLAAWRRVWGLLRPGGLFVLNVKNHIRNHVEQDVVGWHRIVCTEVVGFELDDDIEIPVRGLREGENHEVRIDVEHVLVLRKSDPDAVEHDPVDPIRLFADDEQAAEAAEEGS